MVLRAWYLEQNKPFSEPKHIDGSPWQGCSNLLYDPSCMHIITAKGRNWSSPFFPQPVSQPCIYFSVGLQSQFSSWIFYHKRRFLLLSLAPAWLTNWGTTFYGSVGYWLFVHKSIYSNPKKRLQHVKFTKVICDSSSRHHSSDKTSHQKLGERFQPGSMTHVVTKKTCWI